MLKLKSEVTVKRLNKFIATVHALSMKHGDYLPARQDGKERFASINKFS